MFIYYFIKKNMPKTTKKKFFHWFTLSNEAFDILKELSLDKWLSMSSILEIIIREAQNNKKIKIPN